MKYDEAVEQLKALQGVSDSEKAHAMADNILCSLLKSMGCEDVVKEFKKITRWRA